MSNLKMYFRIIPVLLILCSLINTSQIVNKLWNWDSLGKIHSMKFISERDILLSSSRGVFSKINVNGDVAWKKNLIYQNELEVDSIGQCNLFI